MATPLVFGTTSVGGTLPSLDLLDAVFVCPGIPREFVIVHSCALFQSKNHQMK